MKISVISFKKNEEGGLCGENNILQNRNTGPKPRGADKSWPFSAYDILVNPSHTIMGQWNPRF